ncbi:hypothetical protein [Dongia sp.]|uniref:hypothetical protein n=1 Tax=Dongia sp. TaxID=1977262 RepID=UPI0035AFDBEF
MHSRFQIRRYEVLAQRSAALATTAERVVGELLQLAREQDSAALVRLTDTYCGAIDAVRRAIVSGEDLAVSLYRMEAVGRDIATLLNALQQDVALDPPRSAAAPI